MLKQLSSIFRKSGVGPNFLEATMENLLKQADCRARDLAGDAPFPEGAWKGHRRDNLFSVENDEDSYLLDSVTLDEQGWPVLSLQLRTRLLS